MVTDYLLSIPRKPHFLINLEITQNHKHSLEGARLMRWDVANDQQSKDVIKQR